MGYLCLNCKKDMTSINYTQIEDRRFCDLECAVRYLFRRLLIVEG